MGAAGRGFSIIVECLLQHDADPNIANQACFENGVEFAASAQCSMALFLASTFL